MKRLISLILTLLLIISTIPAASAASTELEKAAETLYEFGLFRGTGTNPDGTPIFDLEKTPTRNQAVIMLVRLLGKEEEALAGNWNLPFTDVAKGSTAYPYIGYAYANGLTNGTSATTYSGTNPIKANQYITFVLRALGYTSGKDFSVDNAWEFSDQITLTDGRYSAATETFTRGDVAVISYNALSINQKGTVVPLQQKLVEEKRGGHRAWYEVDDTGNLYIKTNINSQNWGGYSMLIINHMINRNNPKHYECGINYGQNIVTFPLGSHLSYAWSDEVSGVKSTDIYVFKGTASLDSFWDLKKEYETPYEAVSALPEEFVYHTTLNNKISFKSTNSPLVFTDFKITYDIVKQKETYTAVISPKIFDTGEYGLIYKRKSGNQNIGMSYVGRGDCVLTFTREIGHFASSGASGTFQISHCVHTLSGNEIICTKAVSNGIKYTFK